MYKESQGSIDYAFTSKTKTTQKSYGPAEDVYEKLKSVYRASVKDFFINMQAYFNTMMESPEETALRVANRKGNTKGKTSKRGIRTKGKGKLIKSAGRFINAEHEDDAGIAETLIRDSFTKSAATVVDSQGNSISETQLTAWLKKSGFSLDLIRDTKTGTMEVFLGSQRANSQEGGISGAKKTKLLRILEKALRKLDKGTPLAGLPGSDSFTQIFEKELINDIIDPFRNTKGTKVSKQLKIKHSKSKNTKRINPKVSSAGSRLRRKALTTGSRRATKTAQTFSPLQMIAQFNAMLPQTVAKNMQSPALNLQTGRLASSARVTDIAQTPKGFSSIGYTYDSNYRTFEVGNKQGSLERDPRKLIDGSIREIAIQMAMTRFYTRRV